MIKFKNKTALIIGDSYGVGHTTCLQLISLGVKVHFIDKNINDIDDHVLISKHDLDITDHSHIKKLISLINSLKTIDFLINIADKFCSKSFLDHTEDDYDSYLNLNKSFFFITQAVAKKMKEIKKGVIINVGPILNTNKAFNTIPSAAFSMQKAGMCSLTQQLAMELVQHGIRVNTILPTNIETPFYNSIFDSEKDAKKTLASFYQFHPISKTEDTKDIANCITFLLSDQNSWITGATWDTDSGTLAKTN